MKYLSQFLVFNWNRFSEGKQFVYTGCREWTDYNTKEHLGIKADAIIVQDNTQYKRKAGETFSNAFEKITFKCAKNVNIPANAKIMPINAVATVYGDYRNKLSITCDDIKVL